jgi:hypothetical protein
MWSRLCANISYSDGQFFLLRIVNYSKIFLNANAACLVTPPTSRKEDHEEFNLLKQEARKREGETRGHDKLTVWYFSFEHGT